MTPRSRYNNQDIYRVYYTELDKSSFSIDHKDGSYENIDFSIHRIHPFEFAPAHPELYGLFMQCYFNRCFMLSDIYNIILFDMVGCGWSYKRVRDEDKVDFAKYIVENNLRIL